MKRKGLAAVVGVLVLLAACAPAAEPKATPPLAEATPTPSRVAAPSPVSKPTPTSAPTSTPPQASEAGPKYGGRAVIPTVGDTGSWDVTVEASNKLHGPVSFVYSKLVVFNLSKPCAILPVESDLAESWNWLDDMTLEVKLRRGVRFHDLPPVNGRELKARDVVYSVKRFIEKAAFAQDLAAITSSVSEVGEDTVRFKLKEPFSGYLTEGLATARFWVVAPEAGGPQGKWEQPSQNVGSGPFILDKYTLGVGITFRRNPSYFRAGLPYLDTVTYRVMPDFSTQFAALRSGKLDGVMIRDPAAMLTLRQTSPEIQITRCSEARGPVIYLRNDKEPFRDARVRRAVSMALDREALLKTVYSGQGEIRTGPLLSLLGPYYVTIEEVPSELRRYLNYDPEAARNLLAEAGYPKGFKETLTYTPALAVYFTPLMEGVVDMLSRVGIEVALKPLGYPEFLQTVVQAKYEGGMASSWATAPTPDQAVFAGGLYGVPGPRNRSYLSDERLNEMLNRTRRAVNEQERINIYREVQKYVLDQQVQIYLPVAAWAYATRPEVHGVVPNPEDNITGYWWMKAWR